MHSLQVLSMLEMEKFWNSTREEAQAVHLALTLEKTSWGLSTVSKNPIVSLTPNTPQCCKIANCHKDKHLEETLVISNAKDSWVIEEGIPRWTSNWLKTELQIDAEKGKCIRIWPHLQRSGDKKDKHLTRTLPLLHRVVLSENFP